MKHILLVDPLYIKAYHTLNTEDKQYHFIQSLTLDGVPRERLGGLLFYKLVIYANAKVEPEALNWVLSMLRDTKDEPSGIGN